MNKLTRFVLVFSVMLPAVAVAQEPNFGRALALTATELFVGQPVNWYGPGTVYVYQRDRAGAWAERTRLFASDSSRLDDFGRALAIDGNTLIVAAPRKRKGSGVAYVFAFESRCLLAPGVRDRTSGNGRPQRFRRGHSAPRRRAARRVTGRRS